MLEVTKSGDTTCVRDKTLGRRHYYRITTRDNGEWIMQVAICIAEDIALSSALDFLDTVRDELEPLLSCDWEEAIDEFCENYRSSGSTQTPRIHMN